MRMKYGKYMAIIVDMSKLVMKADNFIFFKIKNKET